MDVSLYNLSEPCGIFPGDDVPTKPYYSVAANAWTNSDGTPAKAIKDRFKRGFGKDFKAATEYFDELFRGLQEGKIECPIEEGFY